MIKTNKLLSFLKLLFLLIPSFFLFACSENFDPYNSDVEVKVEASNLEYDTDKTYDAHTRIKDHEGETHFKVKDTITLTTDPVILSDSKVVRKFSYWKNSSDVIISRLPEFSYKVKDKVTFTAVYITYYKVSFVVPGEPVQTQEFEFEGKYIEESKTAFTYKQTKQDKFLKSFYAKDTLETSTHIKNGKGLDDYFKKAGGEVTLYGKYYDTKTLKISTGLKDEKLAKASFDLNTFQDQFYYKFKYEFKHSDDGKLDLLIHYAEFFDSFNLPRFNEIPGVYQLGYYLAGEASDTYMKEKIVPTDKNDKVISVKYEPIILKSNDLKKAITNVYADYKLADIKEFSIGSIWDNFDKDHRAQKLNVLSYDTTSLQGYNGAKREIITAYLENNRLIIKLNGLKDNNKLYSISDDIFNEMTGLEEINLSSLNYRIFENCPTDVTTLEYFEDKINKDFNFGVVNNVDYGSLDFAEDKKTDLAGLFKSLLTLTKLKKLNIVNLFFATSSVKNSSTLETLKSTIKALISNKVTVYGEDKTVEIKNLTL